MNSSVSPFSKTAACPSSSVLLSFRSSALSPQVMVLIKSHLAHCEFCRAELSLLAHYTRPRKAECQTPDLPINLRILAESILSEERHTHREN